MSINVETQLSKYRKPDIFWTELEVVMRAVCVDCSMDKAILEWGYRFIFLEVEGDPNDIFTFLVILRTYSPLRRSTEEFAVCPVH